MLFFNRAKALKNMEDGLQWRLAGEAALPALDRSGIEGVFVQVPVLAGQEELSKFARALACEADFALGGMPLSWVHLTGPGAACLPIDGMRAVLQAACPAAKSAGLDVVPAMLEPGVIAGYRSISVDRFNFRMDGLFADLNEPVRRARALGAFAAVEICLGGELMGRAFLQAVERAVATSPNQISVIDGRSRGAFGAEFLERAGDLCAAAGFRRVSLWTWAQGDHAFDAFGMLLSGRAAVLGPGAVSGSPQPYANPALQPWMDARLGGAFDASFADGRLAHWLDLASGLYWLELKRHTLDSRVHRHAAALERMGVVDRQGRPTNGSSMEFCHRVARAARQALEGHRDAAAPVQETRRSVVTVRRRG